MINGKGYGRGGAGKGVEHHHVHGGVDFHHCFLEKDGCVALGHDALLFIGQGIAVMAVLVGNLDEHQILNIPGHGGLGYSNAFIAKGFRQFLLGFNDLVLNDFLDFMILYLFIRDLLVSYLTICINALWKIQFVYFIHFIAFSLQVKQFLHKNKIYSL